MKKEDSLDFSKKYYVGPSKIHGQGVFARKPILKGKEIEVGIDFILNIFPRVTHYFGDWINHSWTPNSQLDYRRGKWFLIALKTIKVNEEITMNYNVSPWYILPPSKEFN